MSRKGFAQLPTDEDWDDDDSPFIEAESHLVRVASERGRSSKRCCLFVVLPFVVIALLVLGAVITGVVLSTSRSVSFHLNATLLNHSGDWVTVTWENVNSPSPEDWIGVYSPLISGTIDAKHHAPIKFQRANVSSTHMSEGRGSLTFRLLNMRAEVIIGFFRSGLNTSTELASFHNPVPVAVSNVVQFKDWNEPLQAHLALTGDPTQMVLMWVTRDSRNPVVKWRMANGQYITKQANSSTYNAGDMCGSPATDFGYIDPGTIHQVTMEGLIPGTTYYYMFGDSGPGGSWSQEFSFTAPPLVGPSATTRVVAFGDMGVGQVDQSMQVYHDQQAALDTMHRVLNQINQTNLVLQLGDISYARGYASVWENFFDLIQPVAARVPYMVCIGNHERDWPNSGSFYGAKGSHGECGVPYARKFPMPRPSLNETWYGFDYGSVHFVLMSTEHNFTQGSPQYKFLENHLANVNRTLTPWLIFGGHRRSSPVVLQATVGGGEDLGMRLLLYEMYASGKRPMYVDYVVNDSARADGLQPVAMLLRQSLEPLFKNHSVDLALWGHEHSYQRMCHFYQEKCDNVSTVHVIVGTGGQYLGHEDAYSPVNPPWIKMLDYKHYGFARITANASTLVLEFIWNDDAAVHDTLVLTKT